MPKYYYMTNPWTGEKKRVWFERDEYMNGNLALELWCNEGPYTTVTTNLGKLEDGLAAVDTNNNFGIDRWLRKRGIAKPTTILRCSGFCVYPVMRFDLSKI